MGVVRFHGTSLGVFHGTSHDVSYGKCQSLFRISYPMVYLMGHSLHGVCQYHHGSYHHGTILRFLRNNWVYHGKCHGLSHDISHGKGMLWSMGTRGVLPWEAVWHISWGVAMVAYRDDVSRDTSHGASRIGNIYGAFDNNDVDENNDDFGQCDGDDDDGDDDDNGIDGDDDDDDDEYDGDDEVGIFV